MLRKTLQLFSFFNIDVLFGACAVAAFLQFNYLGFLLPWYYFSGLCAGLMLVYVLDRLGDIRHKSLHELFSDRHRFYKQNERLFVFVLGACVVLGLVSALFMPTGLLLVGCAIAGACVVYLLLVHFFFNTASVWSGKEIFVAAVYAFGLWASSLYRLVPDLGLAHLLFALCLFFVALSNLVFLALEETEEDELQGQQSIATYFGAKNCLFLNEGLFFALLNVAVLTYLFFHSAASLWTMALSLAMGLGMYLLHVFRRRVPTGRKRLLADSVFSLGALALLAKWLSLAL